MVAPAVAGAVPASSPRGSRARAVATASASQSRGRRRLAGRAAGILDLQLPRSRADRLELRSDPGRGAVTGVEADQGSSRELSEHGRTVLVRFSPRAELPLAQSGRRRERRWCRGRDTRQPLATSSRTPHSRHSSTIVTFGGGLLLCTDGLLARRTRTFQACGGEIQERSAQRAVIFLRCCQSGNSQALRASEARRGRRRDGCQSPAQALAHLLRLRCTCDHRGHRRLRQQSPIATSRSVTPARSRTPRARSTRSSFASSAAVQRRLPAPARLGGTCPSSRPLASGE